MDLYRRIAKIKLNNTVANMLLICKRQYAVVNVQQSSLLGYMDMLHLHNDIFLTDIYDRLKILWNWYPQN